VHQLLAQIGVGGDGRHRGEGVSRQRQMGRWA
jgi:hypothetical protein